MEDRLKKLATIIDTGSYTQAALHLHISQPALTTAVKKLERELKSELFIRGSRPLALTPTGRLAYQQGKALQVHEKNFLHEISAQKRQKQPFRLGCIDSVAETIVAHNLLSSLEADCELSLTVQNSSILQQQLKKGELDVIIVVQQANQHTGFSSQSIGDEAFIVVGSPKRIQTLRATAGQETHLADFLAYNRGSNTYALLASQLEHNGFTTSPTFYSTNPSILLTLALQDRGITALPKSSVANTFLTKQLAPLHIPSPLVRPIIAFWQQNRSMPKSVHAFLAMLRKSI